MNDPTTLDFFCSLELRPVPVLVSINGAPTTTSRGLVINKLFTPEQHRKKGYAKTLLEHVHRVAKGAAVGASGSPAGDDPTAVLSFLHSDVGSFYARFGWHIPSSATNLDTTWPAASLPAAPHPASPTPRPLSLADLRAVLPDDVALISASLPAPSKTRMAIAPTFASHESSITRAVFDAERLRRPAPTFWGLESGTRGDAASWSFVTFTVDFARSTLRILRWRSALEGRDGQDEALLRSALAVAKRCGVEKAVAWSVEPRVLRGFSRDLRGVTDQRVLPLGAVAWYGEGGDDGREVEWDVNEAYGSY